LNQWWRCATSDRKAWRALSTPVEDVLIAEY
jgi:hypothetical protein